MLSGERKSPRIGFLNVCWNTCWHGSIFECEVDSTLIGKIWNCTCVLIPRKVTTRGPLSSAEFLLNPIGEGKNGPLSLGWFVQLLEDSIESLVHVSDEIHFDLCWTNEVTQVLIGCEIGVPNQGRHRHLVVNVPKKLSITKGVFVVGFFGVRRCGCESKDHRVVKEVLQLMKDTPPMVEQVMTLVEDDEPDACLLESKQR